MNIEKRSNSVNSATCPPVPDHMTTEPIYTVDTAVAIVGDAIGTLVGPMSIHGTLQGVHRGRVWSRCELVAHDGSTVTARLPIAIPPQTRLGDNPAELEGAAVTVAGRFETHPLYGPLQFVAERISIVEDVAAPIAATQRFLAALRANGVIDANKMLPLAERPTRIGLISPIGGGAGGADFCDRIATAGEDLQLVTLGVPMGAPTAADAIAAALRQLPAAALEAIVICRGGGPASELTVFDHPAVVGAICAAPVPVIVAVGHATDTTAADQVAHTALPTPSAAAAWFIDRRNAAHRAQVVRDAKTETAAAATASLVAQQAAARAHRAEQQAHDHTRRAVMVTTVAAAMVVIAILITLLA